MMGKKIRYTATMVALLVFVSAGAAKSEDWRRLMTEGKLKADLGNHDEASASFRTIADDESAPSSLRWEALVRFGLARSAAGDPGASAAAFRTVLASHSEDPEAMRFLTYAVASSVPGKIWPDFREKFEELLRTARVVSVDELRPELTLPKKVTLRQGDVELSGIWRHFSDAKTQDSYIYEVAAYEIDKMLGLDMVPPTVERAIEGQEGTLQLWVYGCNTHQGSASDRPPSTSEWEHQISRMRTFDYVISNRDRNQGNILVDPNWWVVLVDHTRAFADPQTPQKLPDRFDRRMLEELRQLGRPVLQTRLKGLLSETQVDGLLARRDALLARVEKLVAEQGEEAVLF